MEDNNNSTETVDPVVSPKERRISLLDNDKTDCSVFIVGIPVCAILGYLVCGCIRAVYLGWC